MEINNASNNDRKDVASTVGTSVNTIQIGDIPYTVNKLDPNYSGFKLTDKTTPEQKNYASNAIAQELAKLHGDKKAEILSAMTPENMDKYINAGLAYANQINTK